MQPLDALNQVAEFHRTFHAPVLEEPGIPSPERCRLRVELLSEELRELEQAIGQGDLTAVADALCDLQYVLSGAVLEFGLGPHFAALFGEVHRSNMSKACQSEEQARQTVEFYRQKDGTEAFYRRDGERWLVFRLSDHKTLKSVGYSPARLEPLL